MTTAGPWSVKGIDPRARELAKDLARRSGMTLGEWLNQMITDGDAEVEDDYSPPPPPRAPHVRDIRLPVDAELRRISRALDTLGQRMEAAENRSTIAISGIDQQVMGVLSRIEGVERDRAAVAARFDGELDEVKATQTKVTERLRRMSDEEAPRLEAMRALEGALGKIAEKLFDTEAKTRSVLNDVREDMSNASRRVDRVEARIETVAVAEPDAAGVAEAVVASLGARLAEAESRTAEAVKALETSFAGLDQRLRAAEAVTDENSPERRFERLAAELSEKIEANRSELTERLSAAADGKLDRMEAALRDLAGHVEQGERRSAQAIDRMGREVMRIAQSLGDRVASVEARTAEAAQQMGGEMARIAEAMEHRMGRADEIQAEALEKLGVEIGKIAERLADRIANAERRSAAALDDVGEQVGRVTERLNERYEASQSALADRIRASEERTAKLLEDARETIDRRLVEAQRRNALEAAMLDARRVAEQEEAAARAAPATDFGDDPFGPLDSPAAAASPEAPAAREDEPFKLAAEDPFAHLDDGFGDFEAPAAAPMAALAPADPLAAPPVPVEPLSTRDVVAAARAAARQAGERPDSSRGRRLGGSKLDLSGAIIAPPPLEDTGRSSFGISLPKRKKKESAVNLRTLVVASGTAAALAVTAVGATVFLASETNPGGDHAEHSGPAPTAALPDVRKAAEPAAATAMPAADAPPAETLAVALAPPIDPRAAANAKSKPIPTQAAAPPPAPAVAPSEPDAHALYNTAVQRLQASDASGLDQLQKSANLGFAPAQFYLAKLYETGGAGVKKDLGEARRWTQRAAEAGEPRAMHNLALYEFNGEGGAKDQADATHWFRRAAELGVIDSQYNLARLYENGGYGVGQNKAEAYKWYLIAANHGDHDARTSADTLRSQLPADQVSTAERAADGFIAQKPSAMETAKTP